MVDKSQEDLERENEKNLFEEDSTMKDEKQQLNANFLIQEQEDLEINDQLIDNIEGRKSKLKERRQTLT